MPTVAFTTLGCKVNQYETQRILDSFEMAGYTVVPFTEVADVYVINTCSVTGQAESKSRQTVRRAARQNPNAKVIVTGCAAQMALNKQQTFDAAHILVPNPQKLDTARIFFENFPEYRPSSPKSQVRAQPFGGRVRATIKIQDGCSVYCSYCSIPYTRPMMVSRPYREILDEARDYGRRGFKEIVLTGVLIGAYSTETGSEGPNFEELIEMLQDLKEVSQIRISSIETTQVSERLIEMMKAPGTKVVPHLHIPLQSGSTKVLQDMNRSYSQEYYLGLCKRLYSEIRDLAISTDIMVGFPTESEEDFQETLKVCEAVRFMRVHVFRFSPRPGTPADVYNDPISSEVKMERSKKVMELSQKTAMKFVERYLGDEVEVLVEGKARPEGLMHGLTRNYIEVEFAGPRSLTGTYARVRLTSLNGTGALGELVEAHPSHCQPFPFVMPSG